MALRINFRSFATQVYYPMAEDLIISTNLNKESQYISLIPQIKALITGEDDMIANLANIAAALKEQFSWFWVGFYLVKGDELVLGPFQGPVACTRIKKGKGVCGAAWQQDETLIVPDVDQFPGHIACASASRSEIVLPLHRGQEVIGVLDVDSEYLSHFDEVDAKYLKEIINLISGY
ncbi:Free methionine-R-sulfoxide reductase [compost metagenome]